MLSPIVLLQAWPFAQQNYCPKRATNHRCKMVSSRRCGRMLRALNSRSVALYLDVFMITGM